MVRFEENLQIVAFMRADCNDRVLPEAFSNLVLSFISGALC